ncbi:MAG: Sm ribonucleo [Thermofilum sp. ex4484_79]|nr:MAG: Sm ribonucleo [Thermofilum sp. ex4484_79]
MSNLAKMRIDLPLKLLEKNLESPVLVKLKDGSEYIGKLERSDISMNLILSEAKQINENREMIANYGKILIRGSNILYISIEPDKVRYE